MKASHKVYILNNFTLWEMGEKRLQSLSYMDRFGNRVFEQWDFIHLRKVLEARRAAKQKLEGDK